MVTRAPQTHRVLLYSLRSWRISGAVQEFVLITGDTIMKDETGKLLSLLRWVVAGVVVAGLIWLIDVLFSSMSITASQIAKQAIPSAHTFLVCMYIIMVLEIGFVAFFCGLIFRTRSSVVAFGSFLFICCERISLYRMYPFVPAILYNIFLSLATLTLLTLGPCVGFQLSRLGATLRRRWTSSPIKAEAVN